jgi:phenylalanyl-tRNA synthetase alpha chain
VLLPEAHAFVAEGSPEAQLFAVVPPEGLTLADAKVRLPPAIADLGFRQAMQQKWVALD